MNPSNLKTVRKFSQLKFLTLLTDLDCICEQYHVNYFELLLKKFAPMVVLKEHEVTNELERFAARFLQAMTGSNHIEEVRKVLLRMFQSNDRHEVDFLNELLLIGVDISSLPKYTGLTVAMPSSNTTQADLKYSDVLLSGIVNRFPIVLPNVFGVNLTNTDVIETIFEIGQMETLVLLYPYKKVNPL
jgi:hypothetical protein